MLAIATATPKVETLELVAVLLARCYAPPAEKHRLIADHVETFQNYYVATILSGKLSPDESHIAG